MSVESGLQSEIRKYLRSKGCYVIKTQAGPGVPMGCPDLIFMLEGFWGGAEIKARANASFQPLQKETIKKLHGWSWCKTIYPENWSVIKEELEIIL